MPVLFDSSLYISALQSSRNATLLLDRWARESPLWLSSVVLEELYAGANSADHRVLSKLERDFERAKRVLVPNLSDWTIAGKILARIARKYGYERIGQSRLTNDALISTSAARAGVTVITTNARDFARLAEFCPLQWQVRTIPTI
jgi:predicted nucleic acid-binding protein